jgi:1-acyl-sn-glycerol-3-phosphate acyltransferase
MLGHGHDRYKGSMSQQKPASGELFSDNSDVYRTATRRVPWFSRTFPTFNFYRKFTWNLLRSSGQARRGKYGDLEWTHSSQRVLQSLESVGVQAEFRGVEHIRQLESPCVFVGNHMSMFETMVLPAIIQPIRDVTFVVKQSLLEYPLFRHVMRTRDPIAVSRDNPRADFRVVMEGGIERIKKGISIVVFPQTTRAVTFDPTQFNTIGVKLAVRAKVPVVPIALMTDAWGNGTWFKDLGPIHPEKKVHIAFGEPIATQGRGAQQHQQTIDYIEAELAHWSGQS